MPTIRPKKKSPSRKGYRLEWVDLAETVLGVPRRFGLVLPPGCETSDRRYPVLYLFRGAEDEWAGRQDGREGLVPLLDRLTKQEKIDPMIVVLPGFMTPEKEFQGIPVDWSRDGEPHDVGNGRFEALFWSVKAFVEDNLPARRGKRFCALDGFSMGGWSSLYLATRYPRTFGSAGAYDGSFMWPGQLDPRRGPRGRADRLWYGESLVPYFRRDGKWDVEKMERHNPIRLISAAGPRRLAAMRDIRFHIRAAGTEAIGNVDRCRYVTSLMRARGLRNTFKGEDLLLDPKALHTWKWADKHLEGTLPLHSALFRTGPRY